MRTHTKEAAMVQNPKPMASRHTQWRPSLLAASLALGACLSPLAAQAQAPAAPQGTQLSAPNQRMGDRAIQADHQAYEALQARIKGLNDKGRPVRDYHLSKAQCWLDVSLHEYTRNDRGPFPQAAMTESEKLIVGMERGASLGNDTPLVGEAVRLRPDLWDRAEQLKRHSGFRCAAQKVACAEVELVHAGNEHKQQQWRHAKPYVQIAEDLLGDATSLANSCAPAISPVVVAPPPPPPPPAPVAPPPPPPPPALREVSVAAHVVFNFDKHQTADIRAHSLQQLRSMAARIQQEGLIVQQIKLTGHADRLNGTGKADYNQKLSENRVQTVKQVLASLGIDEKLMVTNARGDQQQIEACPVKTRSKAELEECLLPNRRVDVEVVARQRVR
jgi:OmpA-OmpF porin, OOP family